MSRERRHRAQMDAVTSINFTTFFSATGRCGQWETALHGLRLAHALGVRLNGPAYCALLSALEASRR